MGVGCVPRTLDDCAAAVDAAASGVVTVRWSTDEAVEGWVDYGLSEDLAAGSSPLSATEHRHDLLGLPPGADVHWQASAVSDVGTATCGGVITTPALPDGVPTLNAEVLTESVEPGAWLASVFELGAYTSYLVVFDREGQVRWALPGDADRFLVDVQPAMDGVGLLHNQFDASFDADVSEIRRLDWTGAQTWATATPDGHHMFAQLPDGGLAYQTLDVRDWTDDQTGETQPLVGDAIVEIAEDGVHSTVFSTWDAIEPDPELFSALPSLYPQGLDWTHGNALDYDAASDTYLLSLANVGTIARVARSSNEAVQLWGGYGVPIAEGSPELEHQHDPTWIADDRLLVFDAHFGSLEAGAYEYALVDGALELAWSHGPGTGLFSLVLGQATRLDDGGTMVNFGTAGVIEEVDAAGQVRWRLALEDGYGFAQVRPLDGFPLP